VSQVTQPMAAPLPPTPAARPPAAPPGGNWLPVVRLFAVAVTVLAIVGGVLLVVSTFFERSRVETRGFTGPVTAVSVTEDVGDVRVRTTAPGERVEVRADIRESLDDAAWSADLRAGKLVVDGECRQEGLSFFNCSVDLTVTVPAGIPVHVTSRTGDVTVIGAFSGVRADTSTGDVLVRQAAGPVVINTDTGDVRSLSSSGTAAMAETSTGDVRLEFDVAPRGVTAETNTGDVTVAVPDDGTVYGVSTDSDTGDRTVDVTDSPAAPNRITARTDTGDIRVTYG
jgi:hypothetical protein